MPKSWISIQYENSLTVQECVPLKEACVCLFVQLCQVYTCANLFVIWFWNWAHPSTPVCWLLHFEITPRSSMRASSLLTFGRRGSGTRWSLHRANGLESAFSSILYSPSILPRPLNNFGNCCFTDSSEFTDNGPTLVTSPRAARLLCQTCYYVHWFCCLYSVWPTHSFIMVFLFALTVKYISSRPVVFAVRWCFATPVAL